MLYYVCHVCHAVCYVRCLLCAVCVLMCVLSGERIMKLAEELYQAGFISYPRTETDVYDPGMDLRVRQHPRPSKCQWCGPSTHNNVHERVLHCSLVQCAQCVVACKCGVLCVLFYAVCGHVCCVVILFCGVSLCVLCLHTGHRPGTFQ